MLCFHLIFVQFYTEYKQTIDDFIDTEVDRIISKASKEIKKQQQHLQNVINEDDIETIQNKIDEEQSKLKSIEQSIDQVKACQIA